MCVKRVSSVVFLFLIFISPLTKLTLSDRLLDLGKKNTGPLTGKLKVLDHSLFRKKKRKQTETARERDFSLTRVQSFPFLKIPPFPVYERDKTDRFPLHQALQLAIFLLVALL